MATKAQRFDYRQSMKNRQFEVFHYRDRKGENISVHHHDFYEIYFLLGGNVDFLVEGKTHRLEPGDLLLINPQELHQAQVAPDALYERIVLWIDRNYLAGLGGGQTDLAACFDNDSPLHTNLLRPDKIRRAALQDLLEKLTAEFYGGKPGGELYTQGLLLQFMVEVNRLVQNVTSQQPRQEDPDLVSQVLAYIGTHFQENITLEQLATEFYVSKYYLSHEFSKRVGISIYRYVIFRRLMLSKELMEAGNSPGGVYQSCGFGDYTNFYRAFKSEYGISPKAYYAQVNS